MPSATNSINSKLRSKNSKGPASPVLDLSIVTVTYNERENISLLIKELNKTFEEQKIAGEVIVVDDSSPDGTSDVVLELAKLYPHTRLIKRAGKLGIASAYRDGVNAAQGNVVIPMDADFSHPPSKIAQLYDIAKTGKLAWGSRYLGSREFETDFAHLVGTTVLNRWISTLLKTKVSDNTNGFFAIPHDALKKIREFTQQRNADPFDHVLYGIMVIATARRLGIPVEEIKAPYEKRKFGETKIPFFCGVKIVASDMWLAVKLRRQLR